MSVASAARLALGSPEGRLILLEASRRKAAWDNLLASAGRADSLRAIGRILGLAIAAVVMTAGYAGLLLGKGTDGVQRILAEPRGGLMATILALLILLDSARRGLGLFGRGWQDRFEFEWLPIAGIPPRAISLRAAVAAAARAVALAWAPGLALLARLGNVSTSARFASVFVTVGFALVGDALGRRVRFGRPLLRLGLGGILLVAYLLSTGLFLSALVSANLSDVQTRMMVLAGSPWRISLTGSAVLLGVSFVSSWACANFALSAARWSWSPQPSTEVFVSGAGESRVAGRAVVRPRGALSVLLVRDLSRIANWLRREPVAACVLIVASSVFHFVLLLNTGRLPAAFMPSSLPWTALFSIALPALGISEVLWGEEAAGVFGWTRVVMGRAGLLIVSRCLATFIALVAWSTVLILLVLAHPLARMGAIPLLGYSWLLSASAAVWAAAAGAWGIRAGMNTELLGRTARYGAVVAGAVLPAIACWQLAALTGGAFSIVFGGTLLWVACIQGRHAQFNSRHTT